MKSFLLCLLGSLLASSSSVEAVAPGAQPFDVYVGYADELRGSPAFPNPWVDTPGITSFVNPFQTFDAGAIRIDANKGVPITVTGLSAYFPGGPTTITLPIGVQTIAVNGIGIISQTTPYDFDTSDVATFLQSTVYNCGGIDGNGKSYPVANPVNWAATAPQVTIYYSVGSSSDSVTLKDLGHILDTGGYDLAGCNGANENHDWVKIGDGTTFDDVGSVGISDSALCGGLKYQLHVFVVGPDNKGKPLVIVHLFKNGVDTGITVTTSSIPGHVGEASYVVTSSGTYTWVVGTGAAALPSKPIVVKINPGGACGDPQFYGFNGQSFQVHGTSGSIYNIISTPSLQYNALFTYLESGKCRKGTECFAHAGNYFGEVGLMLASGEESKRFRVVSGPVDAGMKVFVDDVLTAPSSTPIVFGNSTVTFSDAFELVLDSPEYNMRIQNSDNFLNQDVSIGTTLMKQIVEYKKAVKNGAGSTDSLPHGLLGQTWNTAVYSNRWKHIEGQLFSYVVADGIFGTDFDFNRFEQ